MQTISTILQVLPYGTRYTDRFGAEQMMPRFIAGVRAKIDFELRGPAGEGDELPPYDAQALVEGATSFFFALDGDYDHTTTPKLLRQDGISVTYDDDGYGTIHAELPPTAQDGIIEYLRTSASIVLLGEIGGLNDNLEKVFSLPVTVQVTNPVWLPGETSSQETPSASDPDYLTAAQVRAYVVSQVAAQLEDAMEQVAKGDPGDKGDKGDPPKLSIGTVEPGILGAELEPATDEHGDDIPGSYILNLTIPDSASPVINIGTVTDGETPSAGIELEEDGSYTLSLTLPRGQMGTGIQPLADAWSESTAYSIYQAVRHNGAWWYSLQDGNVGHEPPATRVDTAYWKLVVQDGRDGVTPVFSFNPTTASPSSDAWHEPPYLATDKFFRLSLDGGFTWGVAMPMAMPSVPIVFQYNPSADGDWAEPAAASSSAQYSTVYGKYMRARNSVSGWGQAIYVLGLDEDNLQRDAQNLRVRFAESVNDDWHATLREGDAAVQIANASGTILQTYTFSLNAGETVDSVEFSPYENPWHSPVTENDYYLRVSPDGGTTFSDPILLRATNIPIGEGASADLSNYYTKSQVDTRLANKAPSTHTHTKSQITDFAHAHTQSDITGLGAALNAKQDALPSGTAGQVLKKTAAGVEWADAPAGAGSVDLSNYYTKPQADTLLDSKLSAPSGGDEGDVLAIGANGPEWLSIAGALAGNGKLPVVASEADMLDYAVGLDRAKEFGLCLYSGTGEDANYAGSLAPGHVYLVIGPDLTRGTVSSAPAASGTRGAPSGGPMTHTYTYTETVPAYEVSDVAGLAYADYNGTYIDDDGSGVFTGPSYGPEPDEQGRYWSRSGWFTLENGVITRHARDVWGEISSYPQEFGVIEEAYTEEITPQNVTETTADIVREETVVMHMGNKPPWVEQAESWAELAAALEAFFNGLAEWLASIWCIDLTPVGLLHHRQAIYMLPNLPTASAPYAWTSVFLPSTGKLYRCESTFSNGTTTYAWEDVTPWDSTSASGTGIESIADTRSAAGAAWTGVTEDAELADGKVIIFTLAYASASNATLNLTLGGVNGTTTTGALPIYFSGATRLGTQFAAGNPVMLSYDAQGSCWRVVNRYTDADTTDQVKASAAVLHMATGCSPNTIVGYSPTSQGYIPLAAGASFAWHRGLYLVTMTLGQANNTAAFCKTYLGLFYLPVTPGGSPSAGTAVYLVGTYSNGLVTLSQEVLTCTEPSAADGKVYMLLGMYHSNGRSTFDPGHELLAYYDGAFQPWNPGIELPTPTGPSYVVSGAPGYESGANGTYTLDSSKTGRSNSPVWTNGTYYLAYGYDGDNEENGWALTTTTPTSSLYFNQPPSLWVVSNDPSAPPTSGWPGGVTVTQGS